MIDPKEIRVGDYTLEEIVERHRHWLLADCDDSCYMRADLCRANLMGADLLGANSREANLRRANLLGADLQEADLLGANFREANLWGANLLGAENVPFIPLECPDQGSFIGWKKASGYIVKLKIPQDAIRLSATTRKCRCNKAEVVDIQTVGGDSAGVNIVRSDYDASFVYKIGETVTVEDFNKCRWNECSKGIHFFINRQDAVDY